MKLRKVISGGQTGADRTGLECAKELGLETGGIAPKGFRTELGPDLTLKQFGVTENGSSSYHPRTLANVLSSDATVWFGNPFSPGGKLTHKYCSQYQKPFLINPSNLEGIAEEFEVINIAGNRASTNPAVIEQVREAFKTIKLN